MPIQFEICDRADVKSIDSFVRQAAEVREEGDKHKLWFRGHPSVAFRLLPTIGRPHSYAGRTMEFKRESERELLHRFRRRAFAHDDRVHSAGYALFLARHYGLPTRLLDWTANVLFALYFACREKAECDGHVWAFKQRTSTGILDAFDIVRKETENALFAGSALSVKIVHPVFNSPRLIAQEGAFTLHSNPWRPLENLAGQSFSKGRLDIERLYKWLVPRDSKPTLLRELSGLGVSHRSVFPNLDGIARSLWETEVLWNGKLHRGKGS